MAFGKKSKKKGLSKSMPNIAAALLPTTLFTAVPRTPPPAPKPEMVSGMSTTILNSSMLGRVFATPQAGQQEEELEISDPDTSLYDYDQPGYSSVAFDDTQRKRISYSDRERLETPPDGTPVAGPSTGPFYYELEKGDPASELYSKPKKTKKPVTSTPVHAGTDSDLTDVSDMDMEPTPREVVTKAQIEQPPQALRSLSPPVVSPVRTSPRLKQLQNQNKELLERQQALQDQNLTLQQQYKDMQKKMEENHQQEKLKSKKAREEAEAKLRKEQQDVTDRTLQGQEELIRTLQNRGRNLEMENKELKDMNNQIHTDVETLRIQLAQALEQGRTGQAGYLRKQLDDLHADCDVYKKTIQRLNSELSLYQAKYRPPQLDKQGQELSGLPSKGPIPAWMVNTKYLAPLFLAYDDRLQEKDDIIQQYEDEMSKFNQRIDEVVRENERLHLRLEQTDDTGPVTVTEWQELQEQARLVLEENSLLLEQIDVQRNKAQDMQRAHLQEVSKLTKRLAMAESENTELENLVAELKSKHNNLKSDFDSVLEESQRKLPMNEHKSAISDLERSISVEKKKMDEEMEDVKGKMRALQIERKELALQVTDLTADNKQLEAEIISMQKAQKKSQRKILMFQKALHNLESENMSTSQYLSTVVKEAEKTAIERDTFAEMARSQDHERKRALDKVLQESVEVGKMEEKLKMYKNKAGEKLQTAVSRLKEQENSFAAERAEYEREIRHLRLQVREKEEIMKDMVGEKKKVENDLENMWQAASRDNQRMRDTLRKSVRKLREHGALHGAFESDSDNQDLLHISSDSDP